MKHIFKLFAKEYGNLLRRHECVTCSSKFLDKFSKEHQDYVQLIDKKFVNSSKGNQEAFYYFAQALDKIKGNHQSIIYSKNRETKHLGNLLNVLVIDEEVVDEKLIPLLNTVLKDFDDKIGHLQRQAVACLKRSKDQRKKLLKRV